MQIERLETLERRAWPAAVVTIGNFDGVHRGHQALVAAALTASRSADGTAVVLTFDPHPARVVAPARAPASIMTFWQKAEILEGMGVERLAVLPFTNALAGRSDAEFARSVLREALGARLVVVGESFRFGSGRAGTVETLRALGGELAFDVLAVPPVLDGGEAISSSRARQALEAGDVRAAAGLLGRMFFVDGEVVAGEARGRTLGFPTANIVAENETLPAAGVYACWCRVEEGGQALPAVTNVGRRPTFGGGLLGMEVHLLGWSGDLYGRRLRVAFVERLREERAFPSVAALVEQIEGDATQARHVLEKA
jgi:riboflavin kinase/FMN adenylyltransferase